MLDVVKTRIMGQASNGLVSAVQDVRSEWGILRLHRGGLRQARQLHPSGDHVRLHVGCGPNIKPGWINIDLSDEADLQLDLREPLPLPDACVTTIYGEHFFEHLGYPGEATRFLAEALRVLEPGGHLSIAVPDGERSIKGYAERRDDVLRSAEYWHPDWCDTWMHHVNYDFRQVREHKYAWDYETLAKVITQAGFSHVERRDFDPELDTEERAVGSLYVDATK